MSASEIPEIVKQIIARHIRTVNDLEVLLLLANAPKEWTVREVDDRICLGIDPTERVLAGLVESGLLLKSDGLPPRYFYNPSNSDDLAVRELARTYARLRVRVIEQIYKGPADTLKSFADAFRFKKNG